MSWTKQHPWQGQVHQGCLHAPAVTTTADLRTRIAVGFGAAFVSRDDEIVYDGEAECWTDQGPKSLADIETQARADPDHDWRLILEAPLREEHYQRHGDGEWVLIFSGPGFA